MPADLESCPPLYATQPTGLPNRLPELRTIAKLLGFTLMPWQEYVLGVISEHEDGVPRFKNCTLTVPRQCGKSSGVLFVMLLDRMLLWPTQPQQTLFNFQTLPDGIRLLKNGLWPLVESSPLYREFDLAAAWSVANPWLRSGKTKSNCTIAGGSEKAGHGLSLGLLLSDEVWTLKDDSRETALLPTLRASPDPQWVLASTAGDDTSFYLRDKVDVGRERVKQGAKSRTAYFEWGAPPDSDWESPEVWKRAIPAWGWTVTEETIAYEKSISTEASFKRNSLNMWVENVEEPPFSWSFFESARKRKGKPAGPIVLGVDASPNNDHFVVTAAGGGVVEFLREESSPHFLEEFLVDVVRSQSDVVGVAAMRNSVMSEIIDRAARRGVPIFWYSDNHKLSQACSYVYNLLLGGDVILVNDRPSLKQGFAGCIQKFLSDRTWVWWRRDKDSASLASLWAMTLALHAAEERKNLPPVRVGWVEDGKLMGNLVESRGENEPTFEERVQKWEKIFGGR